MQPFYAVIIPLGASDAHPEHPIVYPPPGQPGGQPPHIWGPTDPRPSPPIAMPPTVWPPSDAHPAHPIVIPPDGPPPGEQPPTGPVGVLEWHTVWTEEYGWAVVGVQGDPHVAPSKK